MKEECVLISCFKSTRTLKVVSDFKRIFRHLEMRLEDFMLPCFFKQLTGLDCIGCGMQRAIASVFRGELITAFEIYPAIYPFLTLLLSVGWQLFFPGKEIAKFNIRLAIFTAVSMTIFYIYKLTLIFT